MASWWALDVDLVIWLEFKKLKKKGKRASPSIVLHYPFWLFCFFNSPHKNCHHRSIVLVMHFPKNSNAQLFNPEQAIAFLHHMYCSSLICQHVREQFRCLFRCSLYCPRRIAACSSNENFLLRGIPPADITVDACNSGGLLSTLSMYIYSFYFRFLIKLCY